MDACDTRRLVDLVTREAALLVGVGHPLRGDDAVGSVVAARVAARFPARALDAGPVPESYLGPLSERPGRPVVFVDAVRQDGAPGDARLVPWTDLQRRPGDTHRASLRLLTSVLADRGVASWVLGIAAARLDVGAPLSPPVARAADALVALLSDALAEMPADA